MKHGTNKNVKVLTIDTRSSVKLTRLAVNNLSGRNPTMPKEPRSKKTQLMVAEGQDSSRLSDVDGDISDLHSLCFEPQDSTSPIKSPRTSHNRRHKRSVHFNLNGSGCLIAPDHSLTESSKPIATSNHALSDDHYESDQSDVIPQRRLRPRAPISSDFAYPVASRTTTTPEPHRQERVAKKGIQKRAKRMRIAFSESLDSANDEHSQSWNGEAPDDPGPRRYPIRNRRHTSVYQVEFPQHTSGRNWLAGTGNDVRRTRPKYRHHHNFERSGSTTSSSSESSMESSFQVARPTDSATPSTSFHAHPFRPVWRRPCPATTSATGVPSLTEAIDDDETRFARRCTRSILHARSELMPINLKQRDSKGKSVLKDRLFTGNSLADIEPMTIDAAVGFDQVGGHDGHITDLKESIILPLMYPEIFSRFGVDPPRGVLFSGPPGTGKTLLARALANECSRFTSGDTPHSTSTNNPSWHRPIAFFMRKGADCLSKWVGESERQLRLLFDQAYRMRPSIIFFDEIDGLAPVRSSKQDQIHSSIVSTLLSLMDGLDSRSEVVVIGATNRPDSLDPALRRPGRFDREFSFSLPCEMVRQRILEIQTRTWDPKPEPELLTQLASVTGNFSGADLKALTTEACLCCLRRQYPQVYESRVKLTLDHKYMVVARSDWIQALQRVRPSINRSDADASSASLSPACSALLTTKRACPSPALSNLIGDNIDRLVSLIGSIITRQPMQRNLSECLNGTRSIDSLCTSSVLLTGDVPDCLMDAVWHKLELVQVYTLTPTNLVAFPASVGMTAEAAIAQILSAVRRATISNSVQSVSGKSKSIEGIVIYLPNVDLLLQRLPQSTGNYLCDRFQSFSQELIVQDLDYAPTSQLYLEATEMKHAVSRRLKNVMILGTVHEAGQYTSPEEEAPPPVLMLNQLTRRFSQEATAQPSDKYRSNEKLCNGTGPAHTSTPPSNHVNHHKPNQKSPDLDSISVNDSCHSLMSPSPTDRRLMGRMRSAPKATPILLPTPIGSPAGSLDDMAVKTRSGSSQNLLLNRLFSPTDYLSVSLNTPDFEARSAFFQPVLTVWPVSSRSTDQSTSLARLKRPPSPVPLLDQSEQTSASRKPVFMNPEELLAIERTETQLFRRLRQVLRRVVAHLARHRRFAVFTRPVQVDDAPDYYEVIQNPMDLGTIRDRIDDGTYVNVEDFMKDVELIYLNALEYNPAHVQRSRDIRSRASEFWDEACLQLEAELQPPDLNELCIEALKAQEARAASNLSLKSGSNQSQSSKSPSRQSDSNKAEPKPIPMPQGDRYSRRLHGQSPVLELCDIQILQQSTNRKSPLSSVGNADSERLRKKLGLFENTVSESAEDVKDGNSVDMDDFSHQQSSPYNEQSQLTTPIRKCSPEKGVLSPILPTLTSPNTDLKTPVKTSPIMPTIDPNSLDQFHRKLVNQTQGWAVSRLLKLHGAFTQAISNWKDGVNIPPRNLIQDFQHIFSAHSRPEQKVQAELSFS